MLDLLEHETLTALRVGGDERLARVELRRQIGRLEHELSRLRAEAFPRLDIDAEVPGGFAEPRVAELDELERVRDALAERIGGARTALTERQELETRNRELLDRMLDAPAKHKWMQISRADLGEPGCGYWHSRPLLGPIGLLMGWWRVKVSSGCPLSGRLTAVDREAQDRGAAPCSMGKLSPCRADDPGRNHRPGHRPLRRPSDSSRSRRRPRRPWRSGGSHPRALRRLPLPHHSSGGDGLRRGHRRPLLPFRPNSRDLPRGWRCGFRRFLHCPPPSLSARLRRAFVPRRPVRRRVRGHPDRGGASCTFSS